MHIRLRYYLAILVLAFSLTSYSQEPAQAQEPADSARYEQADTISLGTVQVEGKYYRHKADHIDIYLKKENVEFGTNALDAVSSLPFFKEGRDEKALSTLGNQNVTILINGVPSNGMGLRGYQGEEIKKVEYYEYAPLKYMNLTKGPLVNIITKRKVDRFYSAYLNGWNGVLEAGGEYQGVLTYADSLHQVKIDLYNNYGDRKRETLSRYEYPDGIVNEYRGDDGRAKHKGFSITPSYQYYNGKNLFNATLYLRNADSRDNLPSAYSFTDENIRYNGTGGDRVRNASSTASLNLFYNGSIGKDKSIAFSVTGGYADALSRKHLWRESSQSDLVAFDRFNRVKNKSYVFNGVVNYSFGSAYVGVQYYFSKIDQNADGVDYSPSTQIGTAYGGYMFKGDNMSFGPSLGGTLTHTSSQGIKDTDIVPYIRLIYNIWTDDGKAQGLSGSASVTVTNAGTATGGLLTSAETFLDNRFISVGNPYLKSSWGIYPRLRASYYKPDGKVSAELAYTANYTRRYNAPVIFEEGDMFYYTNTGLGHNWSHSVSLSAKWKALSWLSLSPNFEYNRTNFETPTQKVDLNYFRAGGSVSVTVKSFYFSLTSNSPIKSVDGDIITHRGAQYIAGAYWDYKKLSLGITYHYLDQQNYTKGRADGFQYLNKSKGKSSMVMIRASIYLSKGKKHRHPNAGGASGVDTGLTQAQQTKQ